MIIYGAGGHGKVVCDIILANNPQESIIFVDDAEKGELFYGYPLFKVSDYNLKGDKIIIAIGDNEIRERIALKYSNFKSFIHPSAVISSSSSIGEGSIVMPNVHCKSDTKIGKHSILNSSCSIGHDCILEDFVQVSPNAAIGGEVKIGKKSHIGLGASIIQGVHVGENVTIGAGTVVIKDVPDGATVVGVPGRIIKTKG